MFAATAPRTLRSIAARSFFRVRLSPTRAKKHWSLRAECRVFRAVVGPLWLRQAFRPTSPATILRAIGKLGLRQRHQHASHAGEPAREPLARSHRLALRRLPPSGTAIRGQRELREGI